MSDISKALATPEEIKLNGRVYQLASLNLDIQALFCAWIKRRVLEEIMADKGVLPEPVYAALLLAHYDARGQGKYGFMSRTVLTAWRETFEGQKYMLYLRLKYCDRNITEDQAGELYENHLMELKALMEAMDSDPNSRAPATTQTPGTTTPSTTCAPSSSTESSTQSTTTPSAS